MSPDELERDREFDELLRAEAAREHAELGEMLEETRILLPGSQVLLGFLISIPFTQRFEALSEQLRWVFLCTFFATVLALMCFVMPAAYHRLARPIRNKPAFKTFTNRFLVFGIGAAAVAITLATYLVTRLTMGPSVSLVAAMVVGMVAASLWFVIPKMRLHDRLFAQTRKRARRR